MYTALYARVSTGQQALEGTSLQGQVELCMRKAIELNVDGAEIKVYKEEGVSGEDIDRPTLNQLRNDIASGVIIQLIVTHPDRLSRDLTDKLFICRELESRNVTLIFVDTEYQNTPEGQLFFNLMSVIAQYELSLIKKRTVRGRLRAVEKDKKIMPMRVPPYGYNLDGSSLVINEEEAHFVLLIYRWYVYDRLTMREIGNRLLQLGAVPKRSVSKNWSASSLQKILQSEIYIGKYYYNRRSTRKVKGERTKTGAPRKTYTIRDEKDWILVEVPSIVEEHLFRLAQEQRQKNTIRSGNVKYEYLLKSLLRCGHCGRKLDATTYSGRVDKTTGKRMKYKCYRCPNLAPKIYGKTVVPCPSRSIRADQLDEFVWNLVMEVISDPQDYVDHLIDKREEVANELVIVISSLQKQIDDKTKEADRIKIMFKKGLIEEAEMEADMVATKKEIEELSKRLSVCTKQLLTAKSDLHAREVNNEILLKINDFIAQGGLDISFEDKRYVVETLVNELIIRSVDNDILVTAVGPLDELQAERSVDKNNMTMFMGRLKRT